MIPLKTETPIDGEYSLKCRNLSYIRSFTSGRWYSKIFNPPITAQFLKDVDLELQSGEVMGVVGSAGSGKTTLLNAIAGKTQGTTAGSVLLNGFPLTCADCVSVRFRNTLLLMLTVEELLQFQAEMTLGSTWTVGRKRQRVVLMMREFDLLAYARQEAGRLSESVRKRLMIAIQLISDPVLVLIDEPCKDVEALMAYQLMHDLFQYTKRYNRMAIVTMMMPRSDIYQLFDRITILFYGEIVYSGHTKSMPVYFRQIGYPCPAYENPAVYYLSLATVDRETSDRYLETQEQAMKLVEIFRGQREPFTSTNRLNRRSAFSKNGNPPDSLTKFFTLFRRNWLAMFGRKFLLAARLFMLPLMSLLLLVFYSQMPLTSPSLPQSKAGLMFNCMVVTSYIATALTTVSFSPHRTQYYQESWNRLYGGVLCLISHLSFVFLLDITTVFSFAAVIFWSCDLVGPPTEWAKFGAVLWTCFQFCQLHAICWLVFIKSAFKAFTVTSTMTAILLVWSSGFLKAYSTFHDTSKWLVYPTYAMIYRHSSRVFDSAQIRSISSLDCLRKDSSEWQKVPLDAFCRWTNGSDYSNEIYPNDDDLFPSESSNFVACFITVFVLYSLTIILYAIPMPHLLKRKFRYK